MKNLSKNKIAALKLTAKVFICLMILFLFTGCATKVRTVYKPAPIRSSKSLHLECIKELLVHDVPDKRANEMCISVFRIDYQQ